MPFEGIGKSLARYDGAANSAHLEAKAEVSIERFELVGVVDQNVAEA